MGWQTVKTMNETAQQKYYDQHYNISDSNVWETWQPRTDFNESSLEQLTKNSWQTDAQIIALSAAAPFAPFQAALDIGCSAGDFLIPLSKASTQAYGVDIVDFSSAWNLLHQQYGIHFQKLNLDQAPLPFQDESFDIITMLMVLEHVFDVHHAIQEVIRVLRPGGLTIIQVPNIGYIRHRLDLLRGKLPCTSNVDKRDNRTEWDGQHLHYFTHTTLNELLKQYHLEPKRTVCSGKLARFRAFYPALLGSDLIVIAQKFK
jgi:ubiquinone/menaquinone biosynthesis C-methylase UbiE